MEQILRDQGWEPESNICRCGHKGGDHSSWGNRCLICEDDIFASFSEKELWANAVTALEAAGVTLAASPAPLDEPDAKMLRKMLPGIDSLLVIDAADAGRVIAGRPDVWVVIAAYLRAAIAAAYAEETP